VNCQNGFLATYGTIFIRNVLFSGVQTCFNNIGSVTVDIQNSSFGASVVGASLLASPDFPGDAAVICTNCVFANMVPDYPYNNVSLAGLDNGFYNTTIQFGSNPLTDNSNPFRIVGAGNYYLTNGCSFTNAGTTAIDPKLFADLQSKTVYPPLMISNVTSPWPGTNLTLQVQRDPCNPPALGYHYDPLDYLVTSLSAFPSYDPILLTNGVAVGVFGNYGFVLNEVCKFVSVGKANMMNRIVWYPSVQEEPISLAGTSPSGSGLFNVTGATSTTIGAPKPMILRLQS